MFTSPPSHPSKKVKSSNGYSRTQRICTEKNSVVIASQMTFTWVGGDMVQYVGNKSRAKQYVNLKKPLINHQRFDYSGNNVFNNCTKTKANLWAKIASGYDSNFCLCLIPKRATLLWHWIKTSVRKKAEPPKPQPPQVKCYVEWQKHAIGKSISSTSRPSASRKKIPSIREAFTRSLRMDFYLFFLVRSKKICH